MGQGYENYPEAITEYPKAINETLDCVLPRSHLFLNAFWQK